MRMDLSPTNKQSRETSQSFEPFFFHLTAHHPTLPAHEIKAIFQSEGAPFRLEHQLSSCLVITCSDSLAQRVAARAAYCRRVVQLLHQGNVRGMSYETIAKEIRRTVNFSPFFSGKEAFLVRVYRIKDASSHLRSPNLEAAIGKQICSTRRNRKVNIKAPELTFVLLLVDDQYLFGLERYARSRGAFAARRPDRRPFFKPGTLEPRFARLLVNLSGASHTGYLLDPFCGPGGILLEGALMGLKMIGLDIDKKMIDGARRNLRHFAPNADFALLVGDARAIPCQKRFAALVTDPPYGRSTSTHGQQIISLLEQLFDQAASLLRPQGTVAISIFSEIPLEHIAEQQGFYQDLSEKIYIHRSLTRTIGVFRKK